MLNQVQHDVCVERPQKKTPEAVAPGVPSAILGVRLRGSALAEIGFKLIGGADQFAIHEDLRRG